MRRVIWHGWLSPAVVWKTHRLARRQRQGYTVGDGIGHDAVAGVEADVASLFASLERIFEARPFLLGDYPTLADIGFSESFRLGPHTASDTSPHGTANTRVGDAAVE